MPNVLYRLYKVSIFVLTLIFFLLSTGCRSGSPEVKEFCSLGEEQNRTYASYPLEKRYRLYISVDDEPLCDADSQGLSSYLVWDLVEGEGTADFLAMKLAETDNEEIQRKIIFALRQLSTKGGLRGRSDIAVLAQKKSGAIKGSFFDRLIDDNYMVNQTRNWATEIEINSR